MNVLRTVRDALSTGRTILYECRRCGTAVGSESERCPHCEVDAIARYEIQ